MIESINLENATGIIANFTAGQDLTFMEVADALTFLQGKTTNQAEIIPGIIVNDSMGDKVQVILVITGLGATPVDDKNNHGNQPVQPRMEVGPQPELLPDREPKPQLVPVKSQVEMIASPVQAPNRKLRRTLGRSSHIRPVTKLAARVALSGMSLVARPAWASARRAKSAS